MKKKLLFAFLAIVVLLFFYSTPISNLTAPPRAEYKTVNFLRDKISAFNKELKSSEFFMRKTDGVNFEEEYSFSPRKDSFERKLRETYSIDEDFPVFLLGELMKLQKDKFSFLKYEERFRILKFLPPKDRDFNMNFLDALVVNLDDKGNVALIKLDLNNLIEIEKSYIRAIPFYQYISLDEKGKITDPSLEKRFLERLSMYLLDEATAIRLARDFFSRGFYYDAIDLVEWQIEETPDAFILKGELPKNYTVKGHTPKVIVKGGDVYVKLEKCTGKVLNFSKNYITNESR